MNYLTN